MTHIAHARLDAQSQSVLKRLHRQMNWSDSEIIRRGIKALADTVPASRPRRIIGLGSLESGIPELATNKKHMAGFGKWRK